MKNQANQEAQTNYFNFTADAVAYVNEVKVVRPKKGNAFISLKVAILEGENGDTKAYCDLILVGKQAQKVIFALENEWPQGYQDNGPAWFAGLRIGSLYAKPYLSKKGEPKAVLGGRLIAIKWLKIGDEQIEVPEWRTESADAENYGEEPYADDAYDAGDYAEHEAHQEPPQPRGQSARPQSQPQQRYHGQAQRQSQARQNTPQQRQAQPQQGQQGFRRRNSAA